MGNLTKNFSDYEFACKCGCGLNNIQMPFVQKLQAARDWLDVNGRDVPFKILSGVRCEKHNKEVGGEPNSSHMTGWAVDIQCADNETRYWMKKSFIMVGFNRYGTDSGFVHVDCDPDKPPNREWVY